MTTDGSRSPWPSASGWGTVSGTAIATRGYREWLAPSGIGLDVLRARREGIDVALEAPYGKYERGGFPTPSGRIEIWSETFRTHGYPAPSRVRAAGGRTAHSSRPRGALSTGADHREVPPVLPRPAPQPAAPAQAAVPSQGRDAPRHRGRARHRRRRLGGHRDAGRPRSRPRVAQAGASRRTWSRLSTDGGRHAASSTFRATRSSARPLRTSTPRWERKTRIRSAARSRFRSWLCEVRRSG